MSQKILSPFSVSLFLPEETFIESDFFAVVSNILIVGEVAVSSKMVLVGKAKI